MTAPQKLRDAIHEIVGKLTGRSKRQVQTVEGKLQAAFEAASWQAKTLQVEGSNDTMGATRYSMEGLESGKSKEESKGDFIRAAVSNGYEVVDLGTDVPTNKFIDTAVAENADIIAVSSLLTTSQYYMEELIHRLTNEGKRDKFHIAIGGGPINPDYAEKIGADGYSRTADLAVKMADRLMAAAPQSGLISEV